MTNGDEHFRESLRADTPRQWVSHPGTSFGVKKAERAGPHHADGWAGQRQGREKEGKRMMVGRECGRPWNQSCFPKFVPARILFS